MHLPPQSPGHRDLQTIEAAYLQERFTDCNQRNINQTAAQWVQCNQINIEIT
jgi:hypothetical protein